MKHPTGAGTVSGQPVYVELFDVNSLYWAGLLLQAAPMDRSISRILLGGVKRSGWGTSHSKTCRWQPKEVKRVKTAHFMSFAVKSVVMVRFKLLFLCKVPCDVLLLIVNNTSIWFGMSLSFK